MPKATYAMLLFLLTVGRLKMFSETKSTQCLKPTLRRLQVFLIWSVMKDM